MSDVRSIHATRVPDPLLGIDEVVSGVLVLIECDRVEDEELEFRAEVCGSATPDDFTKASAFWAMCLGSRLYLSPERLCHVADDA